MWYFTEDTKISDALSMIVELSLEVTGDRAIDENKIIHQLIIIKAELEGSIEVHHRILILHIYEIFYNKKVSAKLKNINLTRILNDSDPKINCLIN